MPCICSCHMEHTPGGIVIRIPSSEVVRLYVHLDALAAGKLHILSLQSAGSWWVCRPGLKDCINPEEKHLPLTADSLGRIRQLLMDVTLEPYRAAWEHVDLETDSCPIAIYIA